MPKSRNISYGRYFYLIFGLIVVLGLISVVKTNNVVYADWYADGSGNLIYIPPAGKVLGVVYAKDGDDGGSDDDNGSSGSGGGSNSSGSGSSGSSGGGSSGSSSGSGSSTSGSGSSSGSSGSSNTGNTLKPQSQVAPTTIEDDDVLLLTPLSNESATGGTKIKQEEGKTEFIFGEGEKIKIRTKDGEIRTDVYSGGVKVRFEQKDGRMIIKAENDEDQEIILGEQELFKIEERLDKNTIKIATGSGNSFIFARGGIGAQTQFPLSVDLATNALTVQTPAGTKIVTILPDAAVQNMLAANVINRLSPETISQATGSAAISGVGDIVQLGIRNNVPVYEINGLSNQKLLGFIPVIIPTKAVVSAETGALVVKETSPLSTLLDLVSF